MKMQKVWMLVLVLFAGCVDVENQTPPETPEAFCNRLTRTLKGTAPETALWPAFELVSGVTIDDHSSSRAKEALREQLPSARAGFDEKIVSVQKQWNKMKQAGDSLNLQWADLQLDSFDLELYFIDDLYKLNGQLHVNDGSQAYTFAFKNAVRIRSDWYTPWVELPAMKP